MLHLQRNLHMEIGLPKPVTQAITRPRLPVAAAIVTILEMVPLRVCFDAATRTDRGRQEKPDS